MLSDDLQLISSEEAKLIPLRKLAHLGDAVFTLYDREREILSTQTVQEMHDRVSQRSSASHQAGLLEKIYPQLDELEKDLVRRARNIKAPSGRSGGQSIYRQSTAFEALLGYLYLTSRKRLWELLAMTI